MTKSIEASLSRYQLSEFDSAWGAVQRGIEKESLRVSPEGSISLRPHPDALGSALTNPYITTDFSESLLEFITPAYTDIDKCLGMLENIHRFTMQNLEQNELLWVASMPCPLQSDAEIPLAQYGSSNIGRMKTLYRSGLHHRYGSLMQVISGLHYNFSMPESFWQPFREICRSEESLQDFRTSRYLHLIRNFHRFSWLLVYLFGASPAACKCFVQGREHSLEKFDDKSLYLPNATCLRMGRLGYKSEAQKSLFVCYNELGSYVECLHNAIHTPYPAYEELGQKQGDEYLQINTNLLQLENEFYSTIRPKRNVASGTRPLDGLMNEGIEYIEVRALDLNPYLPLGIDAEQVRFLDSFLLHCLLSDSPECNKDEFFEVANNLTLVVEQGRDPELELKREGKALKLRDWAGALVEDIEHSAALLDKSHGTSAYSNSVAAQMAKVKDSELTPSGQILKDMEEGQLSFFDFSMENSRKIRDYFQQGDLDQTTVSRFMAAGERSIEMQREIEEADEISFDDYLTAWNEG